MECVLFIGIQGSGKSTFYKEQFFHTHVRINLDMLKTRNREDLYLAASYQSKQKFVVDNTNLTKEVRKKYVALSKQFNYKVIGYIMDSDIDSCLERNNRREGKQKVPPEVIRSALKKLQIPTFEEGFDELFHVKNENKQFVITKI
ncbi:AAA family ATPase [Fictibacillus sp. NRS-1165]|uniref:AAA family ATPase n=1 Tax=Fictibacillus sp. NRS-1165 TaxID=3144463 RepID=UPI003D1CCE88